MKTIKVMIAIAVAVISLTVLFGQLQSCSNPPITGGNANPITPQEIPSTINFPVDSLTIYKWINNYDTASITSHAWDIWTGLTTPTKQQVGGNTLLVYETWLSPNDLAEFCAKDDTQGGCTQTKKMRAQLKRPRQFVHGMSAEQAALAAKNDVGNSIQEAMGYNPAAACFATNNLVFNKSTFNQYLNPGVGSMKPFPNNSITTKPTYFVCKPNELGLVQLPLWTGPPPVAKDFPPSDWSEVVYIDINNKQPVGNNVQGISPNKTPTAVNFVNLNQFIYYQLDSSMAAYINSQSISQNSFVVGDYAILIAMHVATKEISNWTWQTFFWTNKPANPPFPSSSFAAALRPKGITGAAANYAVATAYNMVWPNQPISGGTNTNVKPNIAYNPYLEAGLGKLGLPNKLNSSYMWGVQSNCMTCHALATSDGSLDYSADQYIDMLDTTLFNRKVQTDFAWSIPLTLNTKK
ncbi:MAG: hypothetical protein MUC81_04135 [Bacteroidia bacterium]|jgi:hypothetical protein|nr:hypothetical protein [Bacteroidia bacterium]